MSCSRSNAGKFKKRLREKINTDLPTAYPRTFSWAVYDANGTLLVRRTQDDSGKVVDRTEGSEISAANLGTALTRLLEAAMGFANTVTSGSESPADIVHVAGSKILFTAARFGDGFVLAFFSYLAASESTPPAPSGTTTTTTSSSSSQTPASSDKKEEEKPSSETAPSSTTEPTTQVVNDEDIAQSTFAGDEPLRRLLVDLSFIVSQVATGNNPNPPPAGRVSVDEPLNKSDTPAQPSSGAPSPETRARHKSQMH